MGSEGDASGRGLAAGALAVAVASLVACPFVGPVVATVLARRASKRGGGRRLVRSTYVVAAVGLVGWSAIVAISAGKGAPQKAPERTVDVRLGLGGQRSAAPGRGSSPDGVPATSTLPGQLGTPPPMVTSGTADLFGRLVVAPENDDRTYDREAFAYPAGGTDSLGCNTRQRVLIRDSTQAAGVDHPGCKVRVGHWVDAYSGTETDDPTQVSVDHLVALREAWRSGAGAWTGERLVGFGNDLTPGALVLVSGSGNSAKSDKDPASWLPADPERAKAFAERWLETKVRWGLTADEAEVAALHRVLDDPATTATTSPRKGLLGPTPTTTATTSATPSSSAEPYYSSCAAARAAGAAPLHRGEPGYRPGLDRDDDGVACE